MSIKNKVLVCFFAVFILNLLLLGLYYRFALSNDVVETIDVAQAKLDSKALNTAELIKRYEGKELSKIIGEDLELTQNNVVVIDIQSNTIIYGKEQSSGKISFYGTAISEYEGRKLLVKVYKYFDITGLRTFTIVKRLLYAEGIIVALLILALGFVFHWLYVKPLLGINEKMSYYRKHKSVDFTDVQRKDELGQIEREFYGLVGAIEEEKQLQTRIIASISHDIKTPLTSVMGYVERLRSGKITDGDKISKYLQTIYNRAQDIKDIIGEFDEYLSTNTDCNAMNLRRVSTEHLCNLIKEEYAEELALKAVNFHVANCSTGSNVRIDLSKMRRVFGNIIGNALRYVKMPSAQIQITCEKLNGEIRFVLEDNGPGVPPSEFDRIFEAFYTRDSSRGSGSGLGLSICKRIVHAHKGMIYGQSSQMGGLAIVVVLPEDRAFE